MNIVLVTALWRRPELAKIVLEYYRKTFPNIQIIAVVTDNDLQFNVDGVEFVEAPNDPLAQKFNKVFESAKKHHPDAVILTGSSDILSERLINYYKLNYNSRSQYVLGLEDFYFYSLAQRKSIHWHGFMQGKFGHLPIGAGRIFSRSILDKLKWKPYGDLKLNRGLDCNSSLNMESHGITHRKVLMADSGHAVCLKDSNIAINRFDDWKFNGDEISNDDVMIYFSDVINKYHELQVDESKFPSGKMMKCILLVSHAYGEYFGEIGQEIMLEGRTALGMYRNKLIDVINE